MIACKKCGTLNAEGTTFCTQCGSFLEWTGEPPGESAGATHRQPTRDSTRPQPIQAPRFDLVIADLEPDRLKVEAGGQVGGVIRIRNAGSVVDAISLELQGDSAAWGSIEPRSVNLYPGTEGSVQIIFRVPRGSAASAGLHPFGVAVRSRENPESSVVISGVLEVLPFDVLSVMVTPQRARGRRRAVFRAALRSEGNRPAPVRLAAIDPDGVLGISLQPETIEISPGRTAVASIAVATQSLLWLGSPQSRTIAIKLFAVGQSGESDRLVAEATATFVQLPFFTKWLLFPVAAIGALLLAGVVAGGGKCVAWLQPGCPPVETGSPSTSPGSSASVEPSAVLTEEPSVVVTDEPSAVITEEPFGLFVVDNVCVGTTCDVVTELDPFLPAGYSDRLLIAITFSNPVNPDTLVSSENLRISVIGTVAEEVGGPVFYSGDRRTVLWVSSDDIATLNELVGGVNQYRVTIVFDFVGLSDTAGNKLDGDGDGSPGGDFVQQGPAS